MIIRNACFMYNHETQLKTLQIKLPSHHAPFSIHQNGVHLYRAFLPYQTKHFTICVSFTHSHTHTFIHKQWQSCHARAAWGSVSCSRTLQHVNRKRWESNWQPCDERMTHSSSLAWIMSKIWWKSKQRKRKNTIMMSSCTGLETFMCSIWWTERHSKPHFEIILCMSDINGFTDGLLPVLTQFYKFTYTVWCFFFCGNKWLNLLWFFWQN